MFKALPNTKRTLSKCPKLFNIMSKWRNFAKSGPTDEELPNLVTLLTTNPNERKHRSEQHRNDVKNYDVRVASGKRC